MTSGWMRFFCLGLGWKGGGGVCRGQWWSRLLILVLVCFLTLPFCALLLNFCLHGGKTGQQGREEEREKWLEDYRQALHARIKCRIRTSHPGCRDSLWDGVWRTRIQHHLPTAHCGAREKPFLPLGLSSPLSEWLLKISVRTLNNIPADGRWCWLNAHQDTPSVFACLPPCGRPGSEVTKYA